jgi:hypothetical protein
MYLTRARKPARILQQHRQIRRPAPLAARRQAAGKLREMQHPLLYVANVRLWLARMANGIGGQASLSDVPDQALDSLAEDGFEWLWLQGVWQGSATATANAEAASGEWQPDLATVGDDRTEADIAGSNVAITSYRADDALGGEAALAGLRERLALRDVKLMLDFVASHTALDHPWVHHHAEYYVSGGANELDRAPQNYRRVDTVDGPRILAHGREPYVAPRRDTLQLDYRHVGLHAAQIAELVSVADRCDGVHCHGAMLVLSNVFERTWGNAALPFWPDAIAQVRSKHPDFLFVAEADVDLAVTLGEQGFDFCYDKRLYDRLRGQYACPVRDHLLAKPAFHARLVRFLETRAGLLAAEAFPSAVHRAAAVVAYFLPGMRAFHQDQLAGLHRRVAAQPGDQPADPAIAAFYADILIALRRPAFHLGAWFRIEPLPAWDGNRSYEGFVAGAWHGRDGNRFLVVVNFERTQGQCHLRLPFEDLGDHRYRLRDLLSSAVYDRDGNAMLDPGLYIDLGAWGYNVFEITRL